MDLPRPDGASPAWLWPRACLPQDPATSTRFRDFLNLAQGNVSIRMSPPGPCNALPVYRINHRFDQDHIIAGFSCIFSPRVPLGCAIRRPARLRFPPYATSFLADGTDANRAISEPLRGHICNVVDEALKPGAKRILKTCRTLALLGTLHRSQASRRRETKLLLDIPRPYGVLSCFARCLISHRSV